MDQSTDLDRPVPSLGWHKIKNQDPGKHSNFALRELKSPKKYKKKMFDLLLSPVLNSCEQKNIFFFKTQNHVKPLKKCCNLVFGGFCKNFYGIGSTKGGVLVRKIFYAKNQRKRP